MFTAVPNGFKSTIPLYRLDCRFRRSINEDKREMGDDTDARHVCVCVCVSICEVYAGKDVH